MPHPHQLLAQNLEEKEKNFLTFLTPLDRSLIFHRHLKECRKAANLWLSLHIPF